jgi:hypothetical protein
MNERKEVASELLEPHRDPPKALDALEEVLDEMALLVQVLVNVAQYGAGWIRRDYGRASLSLELLRERACVVCAVSRHVRVHDAPKQHRRELHLMRLSRRQRNNDRVTERVYDGVNLRGRSSA